MGGLALPATVNSVEVDRESAVPPYQQVAAYLRDQIAAGKLPAGSALPSVTTLTQDYGIARITAQKALRVLRDEGLAVVVKGWGTFVAG